MKEVPRVVLFADTFHEINGAANFLRRLIEFIRERDHPFLCIRTGKSTNYRKDGKLEILELRQGRASVSLDSELRYDPLLWRHKKLVGKRLEEFRPHVLHLTGIGDVSQLGFYFAHFRGIPAVASWHTNGHEYAARRVLRKFSWLPKKLQKVFGGLIEKCVLRGTMKIHFLAQIQLAPNEELVAQIQKMTRRPTFLMSRGVDVALFDPAKRSRDEKFLKLGYVGRLRAEKNVRFLADIDAHLRQEGLGGYQFSIVGDGNEERWLRSKLGNAEFKGVLIGEDLARAYADMDIFVFPSKTDAFGNVVLEAMAAGVPGVVMPSGGPKFLIDHGKNGLVAKDNQDFCNIVALAVKDPARIEAMRLSARETAIKHSWKKIFEELMDRYRMATKVRKNIRATGKQT